MKVYGVMILFSFLSHSWWAHGGDNDVSDFSWDRVVFLKDGEALEEEVGRWPKTSDVTSLGVSGPEGFCLGHTKAGEWDKDSVVWIVKKIRGRYFAGSYGQFNPPQACYFDRFEGEIISSLPFSPLEVEDRVVVGFMVSAPENLERSNVVWFRLPPRAHL